MSDIIARIKDSLSADLNELLDRKERSNPIAMLNQHLRRCEGETKRVRELIDRQYVLRDTFIKELHLAREMAERREAQADIAERAGEVELRDFARREQTDYAQKAERIETAYKQCSEQLDRMEIKFADMKRKLKDMYLKRMELMSRENIAGACSKMDRVIHPDRAFGQSFSKFEESELYLQRLEEKSRADYDHHTIDARIRRLKQKMAEKSDEA
ncbi:MAG: PspA/IM30 family protein [Sporolactobacillus sp.]|jgi:phage shock protein A|nr:PspA/IM30 family protein [Sporolactobacillus sp.]MCI1881956.1 PspA/IM30 family protein [Sporolactobacillus sp.]